MIRYFIGGKEATAIEVAAWIEEVSKPRRSAAITIVEEPKDDSRSNGLLDHKAARAPSSIH